MNKSMFVAPFAFNGELMGIGKCEVSELSLKWLDICRAILNDHGPVFRVSLGDSLSHLEIKLTSANGAGLGIFYAHSEIELSTAYLSGDDPKSENDILSMFVSSLRKSNVVQNSQINSLPFEEVFSVKERPLHIVVVWANPKISDEDQELIQELSSHFAGAFLCQRVT